MQLDSRTACPMIRWRTVSRKRNPFLRLVRDDLSIREIEHV